MDNESQEQDCAICLQKYHHPTRLPCGHVFCFLCVKGIALQSKKCAMCRMPIPHDYFEHPDLIEKLPIPEITSVDNTTYQWYYEGRNGWWKYDERSNIDLENNYSSGESECLLLLAGTIYCVDFQNMIQIRRSDPTKRRRVKRDLPTLPAKGIAGIKQIDNDTRDMVSEAELNLHNSNTEIMEQNTNEDDSVIVVSDNSNLNSPVEVLDNLVESLRNINLHQEQTLSTSQDESQDTEDT